MLGGDPVRMYNPLDDVPFSVRMNLTQSPAPTHYSMVSATPSPETRAVINQHLGFSSLKKGKKSSYRNLPSPMGVGWKPTYQYDRLLSSGP